MVWPSRRARTSLFYIACALSASGCSGCSGCSKKSAGAGRSGPLSTGAALSIPASHAAYVTNNASDTISVIDRDGEAVETVSVDIDTSAHEAPHHLAIDGAAKAVFVALAFPPAPSSTPKKNDPHAAHGAGSDPGKLARLDLGRLAVQEAYDVDENPGDVVLTHDRSRVLVTHYDMKRAMDVAARGGASPSTMFASLVVLDARAPGKRVGARPVCVAPHGVVTTKDDHTAFIACYGSDELAIVDLSSPEGTLPTSRVPLGSSPGVPGVPRYGPYSATLSPDETSVVVADLEGQDLRVFDRASKQFVADKTVPLAAKAFMPAFVDPTTLLVPLQAPDGLARVDLARADREARVTKRIAFTKDECALPHVVRLAKDGRVYLVCEGDHTMTRPGVVLEVDPVTLATKHRWTVGAYPDGIAFGDD